MDNSPSGQYANSPKKNRFMPEGDSPMISPTDDSQEFAATGASSAAIAAPAKRKYKKRVMKGKRARLSPTTVYVALHRGMSPDNPFIRVLGIFTDKKMAEDKLEEAEDEDIAASLEKKQAEEQKEDEDDPENDDMLGEEKEKIIAGRDFPRHQDDFFYVHTVTTAAGIKAYVVLEERSDGGNDSNACRVQGAFGKVDEANEWARVQFTDVREEMDLLDASEHNFSSPERRSPSASPASGGGTPRVAKNKNEEFLFSWGGRRRSKRFRKKDKDERVFGETFWKAPSGDKGVKLYAAIARVCPEGGGEDELERIVFVEEHDIQRPPDKPFEDWETCSESDDEEKKLQEALEAQQAEKKLMEKRIAKMEKLVKDAAEADAYAKSLAVKLIEAKQADEADVKKKQEESAEIEELHVGVLKRARDAAAQVLKYAEAVEQSEAALVASNNAAENASHKVAMSKSKALKAALEEKRIDKELQQAVERLNPVEMALDRLNSKIRGGNVNPDELTEALNEARAAKRAIVVEEVRQVRDRAENVIKQKQDRIKNAKRDAKLKAAEARYRANYKAKQQQLREEREIARLKEQQEKLKEAARLKREQEKANQKKIIKAARQRAKAIADAEKEAKKKALKLEKKKIKLEKKKEKEAALMAIKKVQSSI
jgi:hypothetical protein